MRAAFERDGALTKRGISLLDPELTLSDPAALRAQLHDAFGELLGASRVESDDAVLRFRIIRLEPGTPAPPPPPSAAPVAAAAEGEHERES